MYDSWFCVSICVKTLLFGNLLASLHWDLFVDIDTQLSWLIMALLIGFLSTFGLRNLMANLLGNINTNLVRDIFTNRESNLPFLGLGYICAFFIWFLSTCSRDWNPDLKNTTMY